MKSISQLIDIYKNVVVQIATPYSTGTGFFLSEYKLIVTNEHVVRGNKEVVVASSAFDKQLVKVLYVDPTYDLAFLSVPQDHSMEAVGIDPDIVLAQGEQVIAVGHPFGLKYTATQGIVSSLLHEQNDITYIQHDAALNPGNSGGPLIHKTGRIMGVNTFIIQNGTNIGFSLPIKYLKETLDDYVKGAAALAVRCNACKNIAFEEEKTISFCPHCGSDMTMISDIEIYEATGINKTIESMLLALGFDIDLSRRGPNNWEIVEGSAIINISYYHKTGLIIGDAYLCSLPRDNIKELYEFLLKTNYDLESVTFSVRNQDIILSLLIFDQYLNVEVGTKLMKHLFERADHFDDILIDEYGAIKKVDYKIIEDHEI
jgi:serine protease Do